MDNTSGKGAYRNRLQLLELPSVVRAYTTTKKHYDLHGGSYSNVTSEMKKIYLLKDLERAIKVLEM